MKYCIAAVSALIAIATAAPSVPASYDDALRKGYAFTLRAARSGDIRFQSALINANGGSFWINKDTKSACKEGNNECDNKDVTIHFNFSGTDGSSKVQLKLFSDPTATMGQRIYMNQHDANPRPIYFTLRDVSPASAGAATFELIKDGLRGAYDKQMTRLGGIVACEKDGASQIAANFEEGEPKGCTSTKLSKTEYKEGVPVYQYV